jgi:nitroimidazol reductase NimA-like FMN-containing flavoprotein (pyridoxamine 5'-phosphate oxidase superfamily)
MSAKMTAQEQQAFLADVHVGVVAITREGRAPLAVPIWYGYEPGGDVKLLMGPDSLKARLLAAAGRFSLCVQSERLPYQYVMVEGPVVETRPSDTEMDSRPMAHRYLGKDMGDQYTDDGAGSSSITVLMRPEVWYSVDYGKAG